MDGSSSSSRVVPLGVAASAAASSASTTNHTAPNDQFDSYHTSMHNYKEQQQPPQQQQQCDVIIQQQKTTAKSQEHELYHLSYDERVQRMVDRWAGVKHEVVKQKHERERAVHQLQQQQSSGSSKKKLLHNSSNVSGGGGGGGAVRVMTAAAAEEQGMSFVEEARLTKVAMRCQVLVVGGGPAGLSAAIAASRAGAHTVIIERFGCFGGVITTVGMETLGWYRYEGTVESKDGIGLEMERVAKRMGASSKWPFNDSECLDAENFKLIADQLLLDNGVVPRLHTYVVDAIMEGNVIKGVIVESKSGREAILADRVIDCSGDADVAYHAGCRYTSLPLDKALGVTTVFNASNVDKERFMRHIEANPATYKDWSGDWDQETTGKENHLKSPYLAKEFDVAKQDGIIPQSAELGGSWSAISDHGESTNLNLVHLHGYDATNAIDLTRAEMDGRKGVRQALAALQHTLPGFEKAKLRNYGMTIGVRDTRKIVGQYNLTGKDVCQQGRFDDAIGVFPEFVDGYNILILPTTGRYFQVPYRCMVPPDVDNLLVAGRCVAGDMVSHSAMRNMMACTVTGQGAGCAAAVSLRLGQSTHELNIKAAQQELIRQGVDLIKPAEGIASRL